DNMHALSHTRGMLKTFQYRLYPTKQQQRLLAQQLEECRWLFRHLPAEWRAARTQRQESLRSYDQALSLSAPKRECAGLTGVQSLVWWSVALRRDLACRASLGRVRNATEQSGYPRFRGGGHHDGCTLPHVPLTGRLDAETMRLLVMHLGQVQVLLQ